MASGLSEDENFEDSSSDYSQCSATWDEHLLDETKSNFSERIQTGKVTNVIHNINNRQLYGRFTKHSKAKTERLFNNVHPKCRFSLSAMIKDCDALNHVFMGFTICGQYFVSFTENLIVFNFNYTNEYELYLWKFRPGSSFQLVSKHKIFKHSKGSVVDEVLIMQYPNDPFKLLCYGLAAANQAMVYITILTIPSPNQCRHCNGNIASINLGWCSEHGFILHYMFSILQPCPKFDPKISLAFRDHLVINTGHYIHILNVTSSCPPRTITPLPPEEPKLNAQNSCIFNDNVSEVSESVSEYFGGSNVSSVVDAIIEDFSEYDLEGNECNKPFHELNISCEPLNVTGKSYHNTLVQNIIDPRVKRLQNSHLFSIPQSSSHQKPAEKTKIDKKIAEKAYEFIEENEKFEKLSLFRKKRLAEKKYEFSEDNSENIVPFNFLRREHRLLPRSQTRCLRSPDFNSIFLSPRSPGMRSPMQSPNSRNGQFSPSSARNHYFPTIRNSPHHSKSPISPKEAARKVYVYSPSLDSDCSDSDSRLILRTTSNNLISSHHADNRPNNLNGLLTEDPKVEKPKWIKKIVRRYSYGDFENSSLISGQSRDDYDIPIEIPLLVQTLTEQHLDIVPDYQAEHVTDFQLLVTQRTFDCEHFVQKRAQKLCVDAQLEFLHIEDYDIKIIHICPLDGHIICQAVIKIGAVNISDTYEARQIFTAQFLFSWNIVSDDFDIIESNDPSTVLQPIKSNTNLTMMKVDIPPSNCQEVLVMNYCYTAPKEVLRDYNNYYEICLGSLFKNWPPHIRQIDSFSSTDSD